MKENQGLKYFFVRHDFIQGENVGIFLSSEEEEVPQGAIILPYLHVL